MKSKLKTEGKRIQLKLLNLKNRKRKLYMKRLGCKKWEWDRTKIIENNKVLDLDLDKLD